MRGRLSKRLEAASSQLKEVSFLHKVIGKCGNSIYCQNYNKFFCMKISTSKEKQKLEKAIMQLLQDYRMVDAGKHPKVH